MVFSDTHGHTKDMLDAVFLHNEADLLIHLGDCERDTEELEYINPGLKLLHCAGNCDFFSKSKNFGEEFLNGKKLFYTHGHLFQVKHGTERLISEAKKRFADIVLFGHTHVPYNEYQNGLYIFNPGSISRPRYGKKSYGIIDITNAGIATNIVEI